MTDIQTKHDPQIERIVETAATEEGIFFDSKGLAETDSLGFNSYVMKVEELVEEGFAEECFCIPDEDISLLGRPYSFDDNNFLSSRRPYISRQDSVRYLRKRLNS